MNSDCAQGLVCTFGLCHSACKVTGDCPTGQLCVKSGSPGTSGATNVCQLPVEAKCVYDSQCTPLVCARDEMCRNQCQTSVDCVSPQVCTDSKVCALSTQLTPGTNDVPVVTSGLVDGGAAGAKGGSSGGAGAGGGGGSAAGGHAGSGANTGGGGGGGAGRGGAAGGAACTGPQLQFANTSQGDANPHFTSAVAVRNADTLFIFTAYQGPAAPLDGGTDGGIAGNAMFVQTFDPTTGSTRTAATDLFPLASGLDLWLYDGAIAPTGEIVLVYAVGTSPNTYDNQLYATFLSTGAGDGGAATLRVTKTVQLESVNCGDAHAIWAAADGAFAISWKYSGTSWFTKVQKYRPDGSAAGHNIGVVPTNTGHNYQPSQEDDAYLATSGSYYGVAYQPDGATPGVNTNTAALVVLDSDGFQVGSSFIELSNNAGIDNWVSVGGTTKGFVGLYTGGGAVAGSFVPLTGAGDVVVDGGIGRIGADGGLPALKTYSFSSTATTGKLISDDVNGAGGVGAVLQESDGAGFVYVSADGSKLYNEGAVISDSGAVEVSITNYHGSFTVGLFDGTTHRAKATVSSCQ